MDERQPRDGGMRQFLLSQPFSILGAIGLLSLLSGAIDLPADLMRIAEAYQWATRPVVEFLFGWIFDWFEIEFPWWAKDYISLSVIASATLARAALVALAAHTAAGAENFFSYTFATCLMIIIFLPAWPLFYAMSIKHQRAALSKLDSNTERRGAFTFFYTLISTPIWLLLIICLGYGFTLT